MHMIIIQREEYIYIIEGITAVTCLLKMTNNSFNEVPWVLSGNMAPEVIQPNMIPVKRIWCDTVLIAMAYRLSSRSLSA